MAMLLNPFSSLSLPTLKFQNNMKTTPKRNFQSTLRRNSFSPSKYVISSSLSAHDLSTAEARKMVEKFNHKLPLEEAITPPSSWYTDPSFLTLEFERVFYRGWQVVGFTHQIKHPHDFFTGRLGKVEFVVCRDGTGKLQAFHNVCRHRGSLVASGSGQNSCFVCPYHGWTFGLDGALLKATRISGMKNFNANELGLVPIMKVATWGPFVLINLDEEHKTKVDHHEIMDSKTVESEWLGDCPQILARNYVDSSLPFLCRREYTFKSNWKVFCDNFIDGGYHVPYAHKSFATEFNLETYFTTIYEKVSTQECEGAMKNKGNDHPTRIGSKSYYAFIFPNFMIHRYGPWMETNLVLPLEHNTCQVISDFFLEPSLKDDQVFIDKCMEDMNSVQVEDIALCESVQRGLESPTYTSGRYVPSLEKAVHHFHRLLSHNLTTY